MQQISNPLLNGIQLSKFNISINNQFTSDAVHCTITKGVTFFLHSNLTLKHRIKSFKLKMSKAVDIIRILNSSLPKDIETYTVLFLPIRRHQRLSDVYGLIFSQRQHQKKC